MALAAGSIEKMVGEIETDVADMGRAEVPSRVIGELVMARLKNMDRVEKLVSNPNFREKAKPEVVETEEARLQDLKERQQHLNEILEQLAGWPAFLGIQ